MDNNTSTLRVTIPRTPWMNVSIRQKTTHTQQTGYLKSVCCTFHTKTLQDISAFPFYLLNPWTKTPHPNIEYNPQISIWALA